MLSTFDENILEKFLGDEEITVEDLRLAPPRRHHRRRDRARPQRHRLQEQGRAAAARRRRRLPAQPRRPAAHQGHEHQGQRGRSSASPADDEPFAALAFKIVTDPHVQAHLLPRLLGHAPEGRHGAQHPNWQEGADRPHPRDARQPPRGPSTPSSPATSSPASASRTPAPATPSATPAHRDRAREPRVPRARHPRRRRAEDQGRPGQDGQGPLRPLRGGPDLPGADRRGDRPDRHLRHGRAPPRGASSTACSREFNVDATVGKPQVAYRETITQPVDQGRLPPRQADRRHGPVRPRRHRPRAHRPRRRLRVHRQDHRWSHPQGVHPVGRRRASSSRSTRACSPGTPWSTCGPPSPTARTTTSTPRRWRSRSPARWRFKEAARKAKPVLLEPIMSVEVVTPDDYMGDVIGDLNSPARPRRRASTSVATAR